jgi:hypothetical protein
MLQTVGIGGGFATTRVFVGPLGLRGTLFVDHRDHGYPK